MNMITAKRHLTAILAVGTTFSTFCLPFARGDLTEAVSFQGTIGLSIDAVGGIGTPVGPITAEIPIGATVLHAYLYSAGAPFPFDPDAPTTLADYNTGGISLAGTPVTNFSKLVGAVSDLPTIGQWYTARADVTSLVQSLVAGNPLTATHNWNYREGSINGNVDGGLLAVVYEHASLPEGSIVLLDGGQRTGGETSTFTYSEPLGDPADPNFALTMSLGISFSCCVNQVSRVDVNGDRLSSSAGNRDDGIGLSNQGSLITAGGIGDNIANPVNPFSTNQADDDELYDLRPFVNLGDTSLTIFTQNTSNDDNIFFLALNSTAQVAIVPEPSTLAIAVFAVATMAIRPRRNRSRSTPQL
jgi:hypothetical protein